MDHLQKSRMTVVKYIKNGKISREVGEAALEHVKKFALQGKSADVDIILQKLGALKGKVKKKKILSIDEERNPYLEKRKQRTKMPMIVGLVVLVVCGIILIVCLKSGSEDMDAHNRKVERARNISSGKDTKGAADTTKALSLDDDTDPVKEDPKKEDPKKEDPKKEASKKLPPETKGCE